MNNIDQATKDRTAAWLKAKDTTFVNNLLEAVFSGERAWMDVALPALVPNFVSNQLIVIKAVH